MNKRVEELRNAADLIEKFTKSSKDTYTIRVELYYGAEEDCWDEHFLLLDIDNRKSPISTIEELRQVLLNSKMDLSNGIPLDIDPDLVEGYIPFYYQTHEGLNYASSYDNSAIYLICISKKLNKNSVKKICREIVTLDKLNIDPEQYNGHKIGKIKFYTESYFK